MQVRSTRRLGACLARLGALCALVAAFSIPSAAEVNREDRIVSSGTAQVDLMDGAWVLEDPSDQMTAAQVAAAAADGKMTRVTAMKVPVLRRKPDFTVWLKFDVAADAFAPSHWLLVVGMPVLDRVQLFTPGDGDKWVASAEQGAAVPFRARPIAHRDFVFPVALAAGRTTSLLLRVRDGGSSVITANLWQPAALQASDLLAYGSLFLYFGLLGGMLLYNLLLYVVVKDRRFILYVGFIGCMGLALAGNTGMGAQFIWGDMTWWNSHVAPLGYAAAILFSATFTRHFFSTRERLPAWDRVLLAITVVAACAIASVFLLPKGVAFALIVGAWVPLAMLTFGISVYAVWRRWPGAGYYLAGSLARQIGSVTGATRHFFHVPRDISVPQAFAFGSALEMILLSLALADRINEERRLKERAQSQVLGILQASQALSSETRMTRLHERIVQVMARVTGATAVRLVLWDGELKRWFLQGVGQDAGRVPVEEAGALGLLSLTAFRLVGRTQAPLVVDDIMADARFADDAVPGRRPCSLLAMPISQHGNPCAVLLLECRDSPGAFSNAALAAVEAIAGPLAVYLQNVQLYERLEQRVAQQTGELRRAQQELVDTARRAGMAEVAANVLHNVGNALNSVTVETELMRGDLARSCGDGLARAVDLLDEHSHDMGRFMEHDEKGRALPAYLQLLADELKRERTALQDHTDRLTASVEHIKHVIAMQQTYAGRSVFVEAARPADLIEEALRITESELRHAQVRVVREIADVPPLRLDRTRIVQILVNLVRNAGHAMEHLPKGTATLTLRMDSDGDKLRIQVTDRGVGIAPENIGKLFVHGFTTRPGGHGFGLHSSAVAALEMGGSLSAHSAGHEMGATFMLELPAVPVQAAGERARELSPGERIPGLPVSGHV
jgi:C4-dicarboxylate-specific signal transduction histidine kinase